jgi:hypothetical protein
MWAVAGEVEFVKDLCSGSEIHNPALLPNSQGRYPQGDETILPERQSIVWMPDHLEEEPAVAPCVFQH